MANVIFNYAQQLGESLYGLFFGHPDPLEIQANPVNLLLTIEEKGKEVLQYRFKDTFQTYSATEYAVKIGDRDSLHTLFSYGATAEDSPSSFEGTLVHFYIDCLNEHTEPNLEMLNLLLDNSSDVNGEETNFSPSSLEHALRTMKDYETIHWNVIEVLLKSGVRITGTTPLMILKDSRHNKITHEGRMQSADTEKFFLNRLTEYLTLDGSGITLVEFQEHTYWFKFKLSEAIRSLKETSNLKNTLNNIKTPEESFSEEEFKSLKRESIQGNSRAINEIISLFDFYHDKFKALVKIGHFRDCFDLSQLSDLVSALTPLRKELAQADSFLQQLKFWGLDRS